MEKHELARLLKEDSTAWALWLRENASSSAEIAQLRVDLSGSDFQRLSLSQGFMGYMNFRKCDFRGAMLVQCRLDHSDFAESDFAEAWLMDCGLINACLDKANMERANDLPPAPKGRLRIAITLKVRKRILRSK